MEQFRASGANKKERLFWILILGVAVVLRIIFGVYYGSQVRFFQDSDHWDYHHLAVNICQGNGYLYNQRSPKYEYRQYDDPWAQSFYNDYYYGVVPYGKSTSFWEPGYPLFLAGIYKVFGTEVMAPLIIQAFLWAGIIILVYQMLRILGSPLAGKISALILATFPVSIFISGSMMSETLFIFLVTLSIYLILINRAEGKWYLALISGLLFGYALLTRSNIFFWILFILPFILLLSKKGRVLLSFIWIIGIIVVITPWMVRNHYVQGEYFFLPTKGVRNFWEWNLPLNQDKIQRLQRDYQRMKGTPEGDSLKALFNRLQIPELKGTTELQRTAELRILALDNIKSDPVYFVKNYFKRFVQLLSPLIRSFSSLVKISYFIYYTPILILTILGIYYYLRKIPELWLFFLIILSFFLITPIFYWRGRFKLIVEPYMIMFASLYMAQLWKRWHHKKL